MASEFVTEDSTAIKLFSFPNAETKDIIALLSTNRHIKLNLRQIFPGVENACDVRIRSLSRKSVCKIGTTEIENLDMILVDVSPLPETYVSD